LENSWWRWEGLAFCAAKDAKMCQSKEAAAAAHKKLEVSDETIFKAESVLRWGTISTLLETPG